MPNFDEGDHHYFESAELNQEYDVIKQDDHTISNKINPQQSYVSVHIKVCSADS